MKSTIYIELFILICFFQVGFSQIPAGKKLNSRTIQDTLLPADSILPIMGSFPISSDTLDDIVDYGAKDSIRFDNVNQLIYLYGKAFINYQTSKIEADIIKVDLENNTAEAIPLPDSLKQDDPLDEVGFEEEEEPVEEEPPETDDLSDFPELDTLDQDDPFGPRERRVVNQPEPEMVDDGRPFIDDGNSQFRANRILYNFKTGKGIIYDVVTQEGSMVVHGSRTKYISKGQDSTSQDYIYSTDVLLTTCDAPHPHYGIRSKKQKIIPEKQVIVGPSNLEIAGVPTPLFLPFGFFPISSGAQNGLIFPRDYEYSAEWGFGLKDIGYYFPINDYMDLELTGDIYWRGSWGLRARSSYRKRYKYNGNFNLGFSNRITRDVVDPETGEVGKRSNKSFSINWSHSQDSRARPNQTFSASVSMQTNGFDQVNYNDARRVLNNQYSSNVSFRNTFAGSPFSMSGSIRHSQNTSTKDMQFTLPDIQLKMNRIFPFKSNKRIGKEKFYERISLQYSGKFLNRIKTKDSLLFEQPLFDNAEFGANHNLNSNASFRILKYFNITPSVNYEESWYFKTIQKRFDPNFEFTVDTIWNQDSSDYTVDIDTLTYGSVLNDTLDQFKPLREFRAGISLSTQIFGTWQKNPVKDGWLRGVRHVIKPSVSFNFSPDYTDPSFGYVDYVQTDIRDPEDLLLYSVFEGALFGSPPLSGRQMALSYSISNLIEAKVRTKRDTVDRKIKLFNNISINGSYNFVADSLKWSRISMSGNTTLFGGISRLQFSAMWDPYDVSETGRRINTLYIDSKKKPLRFEGASFRLSSSLSIDNFREWFSGEPVNTRSRGRNTTKKTDELESVTDILKSFRINHDLVMLWDDVNGKKEFQVRTNSLNTRGNIPLSPKWSLSVGNIGYDFTSKRITYPYLGFTRDLHCWDMGFNWAPQRGTYSFYIRVRQQPLNVIKIPYQKNNQDSGFTR